MAWALKGRLAQKTRDDRAEAESLVKMLREQSDTAAAAKVKEQNAQRAAVLLRIQTAGQSEAGNLSGSDVKALGAAIAEQDDAFFDGLNPEALSSMTLVQVSGSFLAKTSLRSLRKMLIFII